MNQFLFRLVTIGALLLLSAPAQSIEVGKAAAAKYFVSDKEHFSYRRSVQIFLSALSESTLGSGEIGLGGNFHNWLVFDVPLRARHMRGLNLLTIGLRYPRVEQNMRLYLGLESGLGYADQTGVLAQASVFVGYQSRPWFKTSHLFFEIGTLGMQEVLNSVPIRATFLRAGCNYRF